jgi:hypothetical protein
MRLVAQHGLAGAVRVLRGDAAARRRDAGRPRAAR